MAEILYKLGYAVELTKAAVDGSVNMYTAQSTELGTFLYLVECKHRSEQKIGVGVLRELYGNVETKKATAEESNGRIACHEHLLHTQRATISRDGSLWPEARRLSRPASHDQKGTKIVSSISFLHQHMQAFNQDQ